MHHSEKQLPWKLLLLLNSHNSPTIITIHYIRISFLYKTRWLHEHQPIIISRFHFCILRSHLNHNVIILLLWFWASCHKTQFFHVQFLCVSKLWLSQQQSKNTDICIMLSGRNVWIFLLNTAKKKRE